MTVLVAGSLHLDVVLRAPHLPALDETVTGTSVDYVFGGKGGNQAVAAARMGAQVAFCGRAGSDAFGDTLRRTLSAHGIGTSLLQRDPGPSGMSAAIVDAQGDYGAVIVSAANLNIDPDAIEVPADTSLVLLQNEIPDAINIALARKASAVGARVWLNAAPARALPDPLVTLTDLLIVNRVEAAFYSDSTIPVDTLTTLGAEGVLYRGIRYPAPAVEVLSSHGAGDMFIGALAAHVSAGQTLERAIEKAQAAAAWYVSTDPAARGTAEALAAFLEAQESR
jgi:ribokinase